MANKKLVDLFKSKGLLFPTTEEEIENFESSNDIQSEIPFDWEDPTMIIKRGKINIDKLDLFENDISQTEIQNLSMAAKDGRKISDKVRKKMNKDKNDSQKK